MPEGLEAEIWCGAAQALVGRVISAVRCDPRVVADGVVDVARDARIEAVRRRGKVVTLHLDDASRGPVVGLHFGMTGRLVIDGRAPIERLEYASGADRPLWDRFVLWTGSDAEPGDEIPALRLNDPRRLGRVSLDPDLDALGPEGRTLDAAELSAALAGRRAAVKTLLLDQHVVAGLGNLCADEVLFHAGIAPGRGADSFDDADIDRLATACRSRLAAMLDQGGSTSGVLDPVLRASLDPCPFDGGELRRATIGGRTAVWCPRHQR